MRAAKTREGPRRFTAAALAAALGTLALAGAAGAEGEPTRDAYVAQLEAICKPDALATRRAVKGVRADVRADRLAVAARKFSAAARIFGGTVEEISVVPRPPADTTKLTKWFSYLGQQELYLRRIAAALRAGRTIQSQRYTARFVHNGNLANNTVLAFGFDYCSFKFSRFG
jgi:hypothetical protein